MLTGGNISLRFYTSFFAPSMYPMTLSWCSLDITAPKVVSSRSGFPIFSFLVLSIKRRTNSSLTLLSTNTRVALLHTWKLKDSKGKSNNNKLNLYSTVTKQIYSIALLEKDSMLGYCPLIIKKCTIK